MKRKILPLLLFIALLLSACGQSSGYGISSIETLVSQDYFLAFRNNDPTYFYISAALETLAAEGRVGELAGKWLGSPNAVDFDRDAEALSRLTPPEPRTFIIGLDINSFPMAYISGETFWGFDVELANAVCEKLGWSLRMQAIETSNVYVELSSGNIDCAWGGIAVDRKDIDAKKLTVYGPYIHNDIIIATRATSNINGKLKLGSKKMCMSSTQEAKDALATDPSLSRRLDQITRLAGGTAECFEYLYAGKCDVVLTDSTALLYFNCH